MLPLAVFRSAQFRGANLTGADLFRATLAGADPVALSAIPGADSVEVRGDTVLIHSSDSDAVARYLLTTTPARDLEINTRGLEDAFIALTSDDSDTSAGGSR